MILSAQDLISDNLELVSLPEIVTKLNEMVDDPSCTAADIGDLISLDVALSTRLLKVVNSPFYSFPSQVDTISMAITIVGTRALRDLVLATAVTGHFRSIPSDLVNIDTFWHHSLGCATAARAIAEHLKISNSERFFITGLLHDIGKLVMFIAQPDLSRQLLELSKQPGAELASLEVSAFGFDHAELGCELLREWHLPESLYQPVANHHNLANSQQYQKETAAIHLGNAISNTIEPVISREDDLPIDTAVWQLLNLEPDELDNLINITQMKLGSVIQIMYYDQAA